MCGLAGTFVYRIAQINVSDTISAGLTTAGTALTTCFFAMAVFSDLAMFRVERIEEAIRVAMKFVIAKIIIENTTGIMTSIKGMFFDTLGAQEINYAFSKFGNETLGVFLSANGETAAIEPGLFGLNFIVIMIFLGTPVLLISAICLFSVVFTIAGNLFEMGIHIAISPIAFSTLVNEMTRQTGITFIKSYAAVCLQLFVISVITQLYPIISEQAAAVVAGFEPPGSEFSFVWSVNTLLVPLLMLICFSTAIKKSGDITKRMLGA
ncbi:MAG: hypothetical protein LBL87_00720 [Ruminococcus sp.]|nr:hypothetical protein [Ruminococcus sp.]